MSVTQPSTWGMITADSRDFTVATYSLESLTGRYLAIWILTGIAICPWALGSAARPQLQPRQTAASTPMTATPPRDMRVALIGDTKPFWQFNFGIGSSLPPQYNDVVKWGAEDIKLDKLLGKEQEMANKRKGCCLGPGGRGL